KHDVVIAIDLARKKAMQVVLQRRDVTRQLLKAIERNRANLAILERDRLALVISVVDAVEAKEIAGEVVAADLLAPVFSEYRGHSRPELDSVKRGKGIASAIQNVALFQPSTCNH